MLSARNKNHNSDSHDDLFHTMQVGSIVPDKKFKKGLMEKMLAEFDDSPANYSFINNIMHATKKRVALAGGGIATLGLIAAISVFVFLPKNSGLEPANLSDTEIFAAMIQNQANRNSTSALSSADKMSATEASSSRIASDLMLYPAEKNVYNYYATETKAGPKADKCVSYLPYGLKGTYSESYSYFGKDFSESYNKYIVKDGNGNIYAYSLSTPDKQYQYAGGSYAVVMPASNMSLYLKSDLARAEESVVQDEPEVTPGNQIGESVDPGVADTEAGESFEDTEPITETPTEDNVDPGQEQKPDDGGTEVIIEEPIPTDQNPGEVVETPEQSIKDYFGEDAKVLGQENLNGRNHFVVMWTHKIFCDESQSDTSIVTKVWVDSETFMYSKEEVYLGSASQENLIVTNTNSQSKQTGEFSKFSSKFKFELNVTQKQVDPESVMPGSDAYKQATRSMLATQQFRVLKPINSKFKLESITLNRLDLNDPYDFLRDRDYYQAGAIGDKQYKDSVNSYQPDLTSTSYMSLGYSKQTGDSYQSIWTEVYGNDLKNEVLMSLANYDNKATVKDIVLNVGDQQIAAKSYTRRVDQSECKDCIESFAITFQLDNHNYLIWFHGFKDPAQGLSTGFSFVDTNTENFIKLIESQPRDNVMIAL